MTTIYLIRHAENDWVRTGKLAGWSPNVHLNENGLKQADALGKRLASAKLAGLFSSPLERAVETASAIGQHHARLKISIEQDLGEVHYGSWTGRSLKQLAKTKLWQTVQHNPARMRFPEGESLLEMQSRAIAATERIAQAFPKGTVALVSHGDVIKAILATYAGIHLDLFQRIVVAPASISIITLGSSMPFILRLNDTSHYDHPASDRINP